MCSAGTAPSAQTLSATCNSTKTWTCTGLGGGTSPSCTAIRGPATPIPGECGTANGHTFAYNETSYGSYTQCNSGKGNPSSTTFPAQGSSTSWTCSGQNNGSASPTCTASRSAPTPVNGVCGSAAPPPNNTQTYAYNGFSDTFTGLQLCSAGTAPSSKTLSATYSSIVEWTCLGINGGGTASCAATRVPPPPVPGVCGPAAKAYGLIEIFPNGALCNVGTANPSSPEGPRVLFDSNWTCQGTNGGADANCTATR